MKYQFQSEAICKFFETNNFHKLFTLRHFKEQNVPSRTIHNGISGCNEMSTATFKPLPGRQPKVNIPVLQKRVLKEIQKNPSISQQKLGVILGTNQRATIKDKKTWGEI